MIIYDGYVWILSIQNERKLDMLRSDKNVLQITTIYSVLLHTKISTVVYASNMFIHLSETCTNYKTSHPHNVNVLYAWYSVNTCHHNVL